MTLSEFEFRISGCRKAWFEYRKSNPDANLADFIAGWVAHTNKQPIPDRIL